jgi:hypothetical protein
LHHSALDKIAGFADGYTTCMNGSEFGYDEWQYLSEKRHVDAGIL